MPGFSTDVADLIGDTPLLRMGTLEPEGTQLYAKLEQGNPGGSVKDRIALAMIEAAEAGGEIAPGRTRVVEATSGNTGIGLAFVCAAKGYDLTVYLPQGMSREREVLLKLYGATVEIVESMGGMNEAVAEAKRAAAEPDTWMPGQFENPANPDAHVRTTGPEIVAALDGEVDVFVAGVGTGGTITGVGRVLKEHDPAVQIVAVEPAGSPVLSGGRPGIHRIQGIGAGFVPPVFDRSVVDEIIACTDDDAIDTAHAVAAKQGVLTGMSGGAALWAAIEVARRPESQGKRIVTMLPDSGERYASAPFFAPT
ncbi:MAG: cysteine synthase A [Baekduia sp.]